MPLPAVSRPCCNVQLPLEAWIAHQGAREAFLALAGLHPSVRLPMAAIRYAGLFAPAKHTMRWERIADLLLEVREMVSGGRVEWKGQNLAAPLDYWLMGMDTLTAKEDLRRPLTSHNLLRAIVASYSDQAQAGAEKQRLTQGRGETPVVAAAKAKDAGETPALHNRTRTGTAAGLQSLRDVLAGANPTQPQEQNHG